LEFLDGCVTYFLFLEILLEDYGKVDDICSREHLSILEESDAVALFAAF